jgi:hypothetical protein
MRTAALGILRFGLSQPIFTKRLRVSYFSTGSNKKTCSCKATIPDVERIKSLFKDRVLQNLQQEVSCSYFGSSNFRRRPDCSLSYQIQKASESILPTFKDVVYIGNEHFVMLEALRNVPEKDLVDSTGDYGKELSVFLASCLKKNILVEIGAIIDVGGQNPSTVNFISKIINKNVTALIVDINSATPGVSPQKSNVKYAIGDAYEFFTSSNYDNAVENVINEKPTLFIFNNMLNVLSAEEGWKTLKAAWEKLRPGDYLVVSGLVPEQLEKRLNKQNQLDGIVEFHLNNSFYKSALLPEFSEFLTAKLNDCLILTRENFSKTIENNSKKLLEIKGHRLLALRKG